ncbi:hypothetical protein EV1_032568 [Malus domestica]
MAPRRPLLMKGTWWILMYPGFVVVTPYSMLEICQLRLVKVWVYCLINSGSQL